MVSLDFSAVVRIQDCHLKDSATSISSAVFPRPLKSLVRLLQKINHPLIFLLSRFFFRSSTQAASPQSGRKGAIYNSLFPFRGADVYRLWQDHPDNVGMHREIPIPPG